MWPSPQPTELPLTSSTAPLSKPAAETTARRVFARNTTPGITQRSSLTRTGTTSKRSFTGTASSKRSLGWDVRRDPNQTLAEILAAVEPRDRTRRLLDSIEDVLSIANLSVAHPAPEFQQCLGIALDMVEDEKTLHSRALDVKMTLDPRSRGWRIPA